MSKYKINILPFNILKPEAQFSFSSIQKEGYIRIYINDLPKNFPQKELFKEFAWFTPGKHYN